MADARDDALDLTLLIGGVRAGKSGRALDLARACLSRGVLFVATAQGLDDEMRQRIATHRAERPADWETLESPLDLAGDLDAHLSRATRPSGVVIVDCLTLWVSNVLLSLSEAEDAETALAARTSDLIGVFNRHSRVSLGERRKWIVVSNEVGLGIVPPTPLGRRYRDALGRVNAMVAAAANDVTLMVAGLGMALKRSV
jgi:adenosylcobinamide kinase / adenosylcobinamide-phosphate guanylyltransferase